MVQNSMLFLFQMLLWKFYNNIMGAFMCAILTVIAVGFYIFDHTEAGRRFFESE